MEMDDSLLAINSFTQSSLGASTAHERTTLKPEDYAAFFAALENPPQLKPALREALVRHERSVVSKLG